MTTPALNLVAAALRYGLDQTVFPCWIESQGAIRYANRAVAGLLGARDPVGLIGKPVTSFLERTAGAVDSDLPSLVAGLAPASGERAVLRGSGEPVPVEVIRTLVSFEGEAMILSSFRDLRAELKVAAELSDVENRLRRLVETDLIGVIDLDAERILAANDYFLGLIGRSRAELERGEVKWRELSAPESVAQNDEFVAQLRRSGDCVPFEREFCRPDGVRIPVALRCVQVVSTPAWRVTCVALDLTERKKRESLEAERRRLSTVGALASGLAHSLNSLLTIVIGNAGLLLEFGSVADIQGARELVTEIISTGHQAAALARGLLAYSGQGRFVVSHVDLSEVILEHVDSLEPALPPSCRLRAHLPDDLPKVFGDRKQLAFVVEALLANAVEAVASRNGGEILVETRLEEVLPGVLMSRLNEPLPGGLYCVITVRDNGVGMTAETLQRAFDPFFSTKGQGRGLGLAAVAGIVSAVQGAIQVQTEPGKGCRVDVYLPPDRSSDATGTTKSGAETRPK
jgi:two-component system cell cycle sensor histidine kinase/response regulator CckA